MVTHNYDDQDQGNGFFDILKSSKARKWGIGAVSAAAIVTTGFQSFFTVAPTDVAFVRHIDGSISDTMYRSGGLHFKWAYFDTVDRLQVSENQITIPKIVVNATDDPGITLKVTLNAEIQKDNLRAKAYHLLYELGRPGNVDIQDNMIPVVSSYVIQTLAAGKATALTTGMADTQAKLQTDLSHMLEQRFGYTVKNLNLSEINLGDAYTLSSQNAVKASNEALEATYRANKTVTEARAAADRSIEEARGRAESMKLEANARAAAAIQDANAAASLGDGEKRKTQAIVEAFGNVQNYLTYTQYQRWGGGVPQVTAGSQGNVSTVFLPNIPGFAPQQPKPLELAK